MAKNMRTEPNTATFTTSSGRLLKLRRPHLFDVLTIDRQYTERQPKPPTKKTETAFGIEDIPDPDNAAYRQELVLWNLEYGQRIMDFYLLEYVDVDVPSSLPEIERTYARMRQAGTEPPYDLDTADGRKLAYLRRELNDDESTRLQLRLRELMRPTPEAVAAVEAAFRSDLSGPTADG